MMKITFFVVTSQRWWTNNVSSATLRDYERAQAEIKMLQQQKAHILDESKNLKTTVHVMEKVPPAIPYDERSDEFESRHALQKWIAYAQVRQQVPVIKVVTGFRRDNPDLRCFTTILLISAVWKQSNAAAEVGFSKQNWLQANRRSTTACSLMQSLLRIQTRAIPASQQPPKFWLGIVSKWKAQKSRRMM